MKIALQICYVDEQGNDSIIQVNIQDGKGTKKEIQILEIEGTKTVSSKKITAKDIQIYQG